MKNNNLRKNKIVSLLAILALFLLQTNFIYAQTPILNALPHGANTVNGVTTIDYNGHILNITASNNSIINWKSYNIGQINTVNYIQPSSSSVVLNRVIGVDPSSIYGSLNANGRIFLVNPNGIFFGAGSQINVNGLLASTLDISNSDFLAGKYNFYQNGKPAWIINQGHIHITNGGYVLLLSNAINNSGLIEAKLGRVLLAAGEKMTVALDDDSDISVVIDDAVSHNVLGPDGLKISQAIENTGSILADGGTILLNAKILNGIFDNAINNAGVVQANSLVNNNGTIELVADGGDITSSNGSIISAKAADSTAQGGSITLNSTNDITVQKSALLDVSGGSQAGNGGSVDLSAVSEVDFAGTVNGLAAKGFDLGNVCIDPATATVSGAYNANTTVWATGNITITGATTIGSGVTLNIFADNTSGVSGAWSTGTGSIIDSGNYTISATLAGSGVLNLQSGIQAASGIGSLINPILVSGLASVSAQMDPLHVPPLPSSAGIFISNSGSTPLTIASASTIDGNINLSDAAAGIDLLGPVSAGNRIVTLTSGGSISQSAAITANTLNVTDTAGTTTLNAGNAINVLGTINTAGQAFSLTDNVAAGLTQIGALTANTLSLTNTSGSTTLNNAGNAINVLGAINAAGHAFSLTDNVAGGITQTGVLTVSTLNLTNTASNTDLSSQSNLINDLGVINAGTKNFFLNETGPLGETGSVTANNLLLEGSGTFNLNTNNVIGTLAANITGGNLTFTNNGALTVGNVNGINGITDTNNNITLNTANALTLANNVNAGTGTITFNTISGGIDQTSGALTADGLLLTGAGSDTMIDPGNSVGTIAANINGPLIYKDANALTIGSVGGINGITTSNNDVTLTAANNLIVGSINAGTTGNVILKAKNGSILDDGIDTTWIMANNVALNSNGDVGAFPSPSPRIDPDFLDIDAGVKSLTINAPNGNIYVNIVNGNFSTSQLSSLTLNPTGTVVLGVSSGNLSVNSGILSGINLDHLYIGANNVSVSNNIGLTAGSGTPELGIYATGNINLASGVDTNLTAQGGDIEVEATFNGVSSNGSITTSNGNTAHINTSNLALAASKGINITTDTTANTNTNISANNNVSGGISINNKGNVTIANGSGYGSFYADGISNTPSSSSDTVNVTADSLILNAPIVSSGANVNLTATSGSIDDLTGASSVIGNNLTLDAVSGIGGTNPINTTANSIDANVSGTGPININNENTSVGGVLLDNLITTNGAITVTADGNINVGTVNAGGSNATLEATNGSGGTIDDLTGSSLVTGNDVTLDAVNGIGVTNPINTTANQIDANVSGTGPININNENTSVGGVLLDNLTTNSGDITVTADGNINVGAINAGSFNVTLEATNGSGGTIDDLTGGSLITGNDVTLNTVNGIGVTNPINTTADQIDADVSGTGPININNENTPAGGVLLDNLTTTNGAITVTADGNINVGAVNAGNSNVTLEATNGSGGTIDDLTGSSLVTGNDVTLDAVNGIGVTNPINTTADQVDVNVSGTGPININNENTAPGGVLLDNLTTTNGAITVTADGNINVGTANAGSDNVSLTSSSGTIDDLTGGSLITGNDLTLDSTNGIGVTNPINTTANQLDANVSGTGPININNENTSLGGVLLDNLTTNNGNITVTADGNINVGTVNAGNSNVNLTATSGGSILDDNSLITSNILDLNAANNIGSNSTPIVTNSNFLNVNAGGSADLSTNDVTLDSVSTSGDFTLDALTGNITLNGTIQSTAGAVDLLSDNGSINGNPGSILTAEDDSTLSVPNGTIGLIDPVNVNIQGNLVLDIGSEVGVNSGFLTGIVDSSASAVPLLSPANPPGDVYFNGIRFWPPIVNNPGSSPNTPGTSINDFFLLTQASSDLQKRFVFPDAEKLALTQVNTFDPSTSSSQSGGLFLYHPLMDLNSGAFDQEFQLDEGAYDFIDGQIEKKPL